MPTKELVTRVWIEPGCIVCDACETACPEVFEVLDETCVIRPAALNAEFTKPLTESIKDAAAECPVDVIKYDLAPFEVSEAAAAPSAAAAEAAPAPAATAPLPTPAAATTTKAAHAPAPAAAAPQAAATPAAEVKSSTAGQPDPAIAALLRAATSRGGHAMIARRGGAAGDEAELLRSKDPSELPPDARQAKILEATKKLKQDPDADRRAFLSGAALTVGWVAFGGSVGVSIGPAFGRFMMPNVLEEPDPRVRVGKFQRYVEMAPGEVNEDYKPQGIWIIREEERVAALNIICTHLGCIPNWLPNDKKFKCPCHGSGYRQDGINFEGPTPRPLERFRVSVVDGILVVDKSKKYQYELGQWDQAGSFIAV